MKDRISAIQVMCPRCGSVHYFRLWEAMDFCPSCGYDIRHITGKSKLVELLRGEHY